MATSTALVLREARLAWWRIRSVPRLGAGGLVILALSAAVLVLQVLSAVFQPYGYFRDEFYYLASGHHLAWGYVDHPALVPAITRAWTAVAGDSIVAIRFLPAVAAAVLVALTGLMARQLGGGWKAVTLAAGAAALAPNYLLAGNMLSTIAFEQVAWAATAFFLLRFLKTRDARYWLAIGVAIGIGLETKHNVAFLAIAVAAGTLLTSNRTYLRSRYLWGGVALAVLLALPQLLWQATHGWPTLEFANNVSSGKNAQGAFLNMVLMQLLSMGPIASPIWLTGLGWCLFSSTGKRYRMLALVWVVPFVLLVLQGGSQPTYLAPAYPALLAAGSVTIERWRPFAATRWMPAMSFGLLAFGGLLILPLFVSVFPPRAAESYSRALGMDGMQLEEGKSSVLPQWMADRFGWEEMTATIAGVYRSLPAADQAQATILARNYGEADGIDSYGGASGLPKTISGHNNHYLWGPGNASGEVVIALGVSPNFRNGELTGRYESFLRARWNSVEQVATVSCEHCTSEENGVPVYLLRAPVCPLREMWADFKHYG